ncbi:MAG: glucosaminidase domain-containing protein [Tannerella sp.]|jgi:hypothetical protein|nr:glucosaminidase domain-containing protein [Tannerella sp.]
MKFGIHTFVGIIFIFVNTFNAVGQKNSNYEKYLRTYSNLAIQQEKKYNIPASITLAQAILETGAGTSYLAKEANNHFGIKCHTDWTGARAYKNAESPNECFRKYKNVTESYEDHSRFLTDRSRYAGLFSLKKNDYKGWAKGLQTYGYATDKGYANKLIDIIERYELYTYTSKGTSSSRTNETTALHERDIYKTHDLIYVLARPDDSITQIALDLGFKAKQLAKYNDLPVNFPLEQGDIIYLEKKKAKADRAYSFHVVKIGDSMHSISQRYGIQLKSLYKLNKKKDDYVPIEDVVLKLR